MSHARWRVSLAFQGQQYLAALEVIGLPEVQGLDGEFVKTNGFFISEERNAPFAGPDRIVNRLFDITERSRLEEVVGEFGQMSLQVGAINLLQRLANPLVYPSAARRQLCIQGLANESMGEAIAAEGTGYFLNDMGSQRFLHHFQQSFTGKVSDLLQDVQAELPADHGSDRQDAVALCR
jgi:hypothetical protein